jgi:low affinity Fe/Cu permease
LTAFGVLTARPTAFIVVSVYGLLWWWFDPDTLEWHSVASLATWLMTLVIRRAEHRDTQAIHAKLDELLHAARGASNHLTKVDDEEPEEIEKRREHLRRRD